MRPDSPCEPGMQPRVPVTPGEENSVLALRQTQRSPEGPRHLHKQPLTLTCPQKLQAQPPQAGLLPLPAHLGLGLRVGERIGGQQSEGALLGVLGVVV